MDRQEKAAALWGALHSLIRNGGGYVISPPFQNPIRFEVSPSSELAKDLAKRGFTVRDYGAVDKLAPVNETVREHGRPASETVTRQHIAMTTMKLFEMDLPLVRSEPGAPRIAPRIKKRLALVPTFRGFVMRIK
jgi:hypothetical protein